MSETVTHLAACNYVGGEFWSAGQKCTTTRRIFVHDSIYDEFRRRLLARGSQTAGADVHVPFGGIKGSGWGPHEQGRAAMAFFTDLVTVYQDAPLA